MDKLADYSLPLPIQWYEGMLLRPQHFQQFDIFHQLFTTQHMKYMSPFHYGIIHLDLDQMAIPDGLIRINNVKAVLPDGTIIEYPLNTQNSLEIDIKALRKDIQEAPQFVYLCLPELNPALSRVIGDWPRYDSIESADIVDENTNDNAIRIPRLQPKLTLIAGARPPSRFTAIPIAKVGFLDESFVLYPFTPPCFTVSQESLLGKLLVNIALRLREKAYYLSEKCKNQVGTPMLQETTNMLRPLLHLLPSFEAMLRTESSHPFDIYLKTCEMLGNLCGLRINMIPPSFPLYQHNHIYESFTPVIELINTLIDSIDLTYTVILFEQKERLFYLKLFENYCSEKQGIFVGIRAAGSMTEAELMDWVKDCVICSDSAIEDVRIKRITGAPRKILSTEEASDLMPSRGVLIIKIEGTSEFVNVKEHLNIFNPADTIGKRPIEIALYVKQSILKNDGDNA